MTWEPSAGSWRSAFRATGTAEPTRHATVMLMSMAVNTTPPKAGEPPQ